MQEFKIESDAIGRDLMFSALSWGAVLVLLVLAVLSFIFRVSEVLFLLSVLGSVIGASVLACREALHYAFRQMVFVLNGNEIIRRRQGFPERKIAFSEVENQSEERGYLIVKSGDPE